MPHSCYPATPLCPSEELTKPGTCLTSSHQPFIIHKQRQFPPCTCCNSALPTSCPLALYAPCSSQLCQIFTFYHTPSRDHSLDHFIQATSFTSEALTHYSLWISLPELWVIFKLTLIKSSIQVLFQKSLMVWATHIHGTSNPRFPTGVHRDGYFNFWLSLMKEIRSYITIF